MSSISKNKTNPSQKLERSSTTTWKSIHTYTPQSHENLLKQFSKMSAQQDNLKKIAQENKSLKQELRKARTEVERQKKRINKLEHKLRNVKPSSSNAYTTESPSNDEENKGKTNLKLDHDTDEQYSEEYLSHHFSEVMRRHRNEVVEKDHQIKKLQQELAQYSNQSNTRNRQPGHEKQIWTHDFSRKSSSPSATKLLRRPTSGIRKPTATERLGRSSSKVRESSTADEHLRRPTPEKRKSPTANRHFGRPTSEGKRSPTAKESLRRPSSGIRKSPIAIERPGRSRSKVRKSSTANEHLRRPTSEGKKSPTYKESLRRPNSKIIKFYTPNDGLERPTSEVKDDLQEDTIKDKLHRPVLTKEKSTRDDYHRKFGIVTDIDKMKHDILAKLELEEKLDKLHWKIETRRAICQEDNEVNGEQTSSRHKEFQMLQTTRDNLLKALCDVKKKLKDDVMINESQHHVDGDSNISTIQALYDSSNISTYSSKPNIMNN